MLKHLELKDTVLKCNMIHRKTINIFNIGIKIVYSWSLLLTYFVAFLNNRMPTVGPDSALF